MRYLSQIKRLLLVLGGIFTFSSVALAYPTLQLDILGGTYRSSTQTIVASGNAFTLYAYLKADSSNTILDTYYISAAVSPQFGPSGGSLGSFVFNGSTVDVTTDMTYGVPPLEVGLIATSDPKDLQTHSIFPTYFSEFGFQFSGSQSSLYNTQNESGSGPHAGTGMYYQAFTVDIGNLESGYVIHFDLYNTKLKSGDVDITQFAPFSHDAESSPAEQVPEPVSLTLLATGCIALLVALKRRSASR